MDQEADRSIRLDPARITGFAIAMMLNIAVMMMLWRGIDSADPAPMPPISTRTPTITLVPPKPEPLPILQPPPPTVKVVRQNLTPAPPPPQPPLVETARTSDYLAPPTLPSIAAPTTQANSQAVGSGAASLGSTLGYRDAPIPPYPRVALQRGWQGTVWLMVTVDAEGRPTAVDIHQSSGHSALDRGARSHVLKRWRFTPAMVDGRPVAARGLVPIDYRLD